MKEGYRFLVWLSILVFFLINLISFAIISSVENVSEICDERLVPLALFAIAFNVVQVVVFMEIKKDTTLIFLLKVCLLIPSMLLIVFFWLRFYKCIEQLPISLQFLFILEVIMAHINVVLVGGYVIYYISKTTHGQYIAIE